MADLWLYGKATTQEGDTIERRIWLVPKSDSFPQGIKYSLNFIHNSKRIVGYDNERSKGHHKHYFDKEHPYNYNNVHQLMVDFWKDVNKIRRILYGSKKN